VQDLVIEALKCHSCEARLLLRLQTTRQPEPAWRWFECPHCHKANFARLRGQIVEVMKNAQEV
jgi:hypothetical protein